MTYHSPDCKRVFSRLDPECPRCAELKSGAAPRKGWNSRKTYDIRRANEVREHLRSEHHMSGGCGPVCTFGDW